MLQEILKFKKINKRSKNINRGKGFVKKFLLNLAVDGKGTSFPSLEY